MEEHVAEDVHRQRRVTVDDLGVVTGRLFIGERIEASADAVHRLGDCASAAPLGPFEQHVFDEMRDPAVVVSLQRRSDVGPNADRNRAHRRHRLGQHTQSTGQRRFAVHRLPQSSPCFLKALRAHSSSQKTPSPGPVARASISAADSPRRVVMLNTVRDVGTAKSPLTTSPLATSIGTLAQTSTSSATGAAANALARMSVDHFGHELAAADLIVKLYAPDANADDEVMVHLIGGDLAHLGRPRRREDVLANPGSDVDTIARGARGRVEIGDRGDRRAGRAGLEGRHDGEPPAAASAANTTAQNTRSLSRARRTRRNDSRHFRRVHADCASWRPSAP